MYCLLYHCFLVLAGAYWTFLSSPPSLSEGSNERELNKCKRRSFLLEKLRLNAIYFVLTIMFCAIDIPIYNTNCEQSSSMSERDSDLSTANRSIYTSLSNTHLAERLL